MAPEVMMGDAYDERADVFSFGVVCNEIITGYDAGHFRRLVEDGYILVSAFASTSDAERQLTHIGLHWTLSIFIHLFHMILLLVFFHLL